MSIFEKFITKQEKQKDVLHGKPLRIDSVMDDRRGIIEEYSVKWGDRKIFCKDDNYQTVKKVFNVLMEKNINPENLSQEDIEKLLEKNEEK